jgi:UDP-N-acetylglucosamine--N-acetylmuramyl-(pentapeptide) pyrophosphoryl-undecaprenol N-acetylglucosamine transferase
MCVVGEGMRRRYLFGAGGTSGHINPALAIADTIAVREPDSEIVFSGTENGLEAELIKRAGYQMELIRARGISETRRKRFCAFIRENTAGVSAGLRLIRKYRPHLVIGTGGYVCSPLVLAALFLRVPVLLHEQNAFPGRSNRLFAPYTKSVCISFAESKKYFSKRSHLRLSGNPVRREFFELERKEARRTLGLDDSTFLVLMMGGSVGASSLSESVIHLKDNQVWKTLAAQGVRIKLSTGHDQAKDYVEPAKAVPGVDAEAYIHDGAVWMAACDLFIGRAGAMTCAELAALGKASILVPYPYAISDHQTHNAATMTDAGAAELLTDAELSGDVLAEKIRGYVSDRALLDMMEKAAAQLAIPNALDIIYDEIVRVRRDG